MWGNQPTYAALAVACLAAAILLAAALFVWDRSRRGAHVFLLVQFLVPLAMVFLLMRARPGYHPRYIVHLLVPLVVLVAQGLVTLFRRGKALRVAAALLLALWLATGGLATYTLLSDTNYYRDDARAAAALLAERLEPGQLVLLSVDDWAVRYYLQDSDLDVRFVSPASLLADADSQIGAMFGRYHEVALVEWVQGTADPGGVLSFMLERWGKRISTTNLPAYSVEVYDLEVQTPAVMEVDPDTQIGSLRLLTASIETLCPTDDALTVALTWRKEAADDQDYELVIPLRDEQGRVMMQRNRTLCAADGRRSGEWQAGETVTTYVSASLPTGLAPVRYDLRVGLYLPDAPEGVDVLDAAGAAAGKRLTLATVTTGRAGEPCGG